MEAKENKMKTVRYPKPTDNLNVNRAIDEIYDTMNKSDIEITLYVPALIYILANGYKQCNYNYQEFRDELHDAFEFYKIIFEEEK